MLEFILEVRTVIRLHKEGKVEKEDTLSKGNMAEVAQELLDVNDVSCRASKVLLNWQGSSYVERLLGRRGIIQQMRRLLLSVGMS